MAPALALLAAIRTDLMLGAGWVINLAVAEWFLRRPSGRSQERRPRPALAGSS